MSRVCIGVPTYEHWKAEMATSLIGALFRLPHEWMLTVKRGCYIDVAREECVVSALEKDADVLLFIDTDMMFPPEAVEQLLAHDKDIVGGAYHEKRLPLVTTVKLSDGNGGFVVGGHLPDEVFPCAAVATGFMAINLKRLTQCMAPPYFAYETGQRLALEASLGRAGEDVAFCVRAAKAGLQVWCDPTIPLKHLGEFAF